MKVLASLPIAIAAVFTVPAAIAEDSPHEFSANVALATDYVYRGFSQTGNGPAIQGGFDYSYTPFGFYAGVWGSNINFGDNSPVELDYYAGFAGEFSNGIGWDIGGLYYHYPADGDPNPEQDFIEAYGSLSYTFAAQLDPTIGVNFAWSPDFYLETGDALNTGVSFGVTLPYEIGLSSAVNWQDIDEGDSYLYWSFGASKDIAIFTFDVTYYDTDSTPTNNLNDGRVVLSVSSSF